jgi:Bacterial membrane protein YfhO
LNTAVAGMRRSTSALRVVVPLAVFAVATFIFVARPLLGQRTYIAVDLLENTAPYRDAIARPPDFASPGQNDQVEQFGPAAISSARSLEDLDWQTWDPHIAAGTPAAIPPLTANVPPFNWTYLFLPAWYAVGLTAALAIFACQGFMYLFLRRLGVMMLPAIVGALTYGFTGTNIAFINRIWAPFLLPALLWAVHRLVDKPTFPASLVLGGFVAWAWYEGFPSAWVYCMATTVAFAAVLLGARWFRMARTASPARDRSARRAWARRRVGMLGFGLAWGAALAALTLIPFLHELSARDVFSTRGTDSNAHLEPINVFGLLTSHVPGPPARGPWWTNLHPYEGTAYLGLAAVAIVVLGLLLASMRRLRASSDGEVSFMFFSTVGVVVIVLCYVGTPLLGLVYRIPGFAENPIWRMRFLIGLAAAVLLAVTLDSLWRHGLPAVRNSAVLAWWSRATLVALAVIFARYAPRFLDAAGGADARHDLLRNAAIAIGVLLVVLSAVRWPKLAVAAALVGGATIYLQLIVPGYDFTPAARKSDYYTEQSGHRTLKRLTRDRFRYAASGTNFTWNTSDVFGTYDLRGIVLHAPEFRRLMREVSEQAFVPNPFNISLLRDQWNLAAPVLDHLGVRYFVLGTNELPYGSADRQVPTPASWVPADAHHPVALPTLVERIDGIIVPLRASGNCTTGSVHVRLSRGGAMSSTSRPLHDVSGTPLAFAIKNPRPSTGELNVQVVATNPDCNLELGVSADGSFGGAVLHIDDDAPVRLASTNQAWIYERPSASPMVTSYGRWIRFRSQTEALNWLRNRPATDADVVPVVGDVRPSAATGEPARVMERHIEDESVTAQVRAETSSLVSAGQVVGDGWEATVDGKASRMVLVDGGIMATPVPPGAHRVEFRYEPKTVRTGALLSGGALAVAFVGLVVVAIRRLQKPGSKSDRTADAAPGGTIEVLAGSRGT